VIYYEERDSSLRSIFLLLHNKNPRLFGAFFGINYFTYANIPRILEEMSFPQVMHRKRYI